MAYKTVVVHVDTTNRAAQRIKLASEIAAGSEGHVIGLAASGIAQFFYQSMGPGAEAPYIATQVELAEEMGERALDGFEAEIKRAEPAITWERRLFHDDGAGSLVSISPYADLLVVGQTSPDLPTLGAIPNFAAYVMLNTASPVLIVPHSGNFSGIHENVLVAWDGSLSATRALHNALPVLCRAKRVDILIVNPESESAISPSSSEPGIEIASFLSRHSLAVNVIIKENRKDIGKAILETADAAGATSLVMGGYGHTRFREMLLGGATNTVLAEATLPVFMSH